MDFGLTQPQELLRDSIARFLAQDVGIERVRRVMDSESGQDEAIHGQLGDQGITGLLVDMDLGGSELGMQEAGIAAQEIGRAAAPVNFHSSYVLAPLLIAGTGDSERRTGTARRDRRRPAPGHADPRRPYLERPRRRDRALRARRRLVRRVPARIRRQFAPARDDHARNRGRAPSDRR